MAKQPWTVEGHGEAQPLLRDGQGDWVATFGNLNDIFRAAICHNALLDIPDPEAFMSAHDKLVAACEALRIERGMLGLALDGNNEEMFVELNYVEMALAAVKEAS